MWNQIQISGITDEIELSHIYNGRRFFKMMLHSPRLSEAYDVIPVIFGEEMLNGFLNVEKVIVKGQVRTRNYYDSEDKRHLSIFVYASEVTELKDEEYCNYVYISGHLCKEPNYRITPRERKITDLLIGCYCDRKASFIPCIAWGDNAQRVSELEKGDYLSFTGRLQSRSYVKNEQERVAYEISINTIEEEGRKNG